MEIVRRGIYAVRDRDGLCDVHDVKNGHPCCRSIIFRDAVRTCRQRNEEESERQTFTSPVMRSGDAVVLPYMFQHAEDDPRSCGRACYIRLRER